MYETHFGLSGNPFGLNPDPSFYFGSRGHAHALSYLKFGVFQGEGFIIVTGEIGAGKTTLVRTLLSELDAQRVVAAQLVSTRLEASDLLRSVATAFGLAASGLSKAELIATIEAFLTFQASEGRRSLLVVDEAQNLDPSAVEELRMLSNFQLGKDALLQSFLVGQPELRALLASKAMEQFRQRVIASCHLSPMEATETGQYVLHRLRHVGWTGTPDFEPAALEEIHLASGGVPRRINQLCNRVMLAAFLESRGGIDSGLVAAAAKEIRAEITVDDEAVHRVPAIVPTEHETSSRRLVVPSFAAAGVADRRRPIVIVSGSRTEDLKAIALLKAMADRERLPPAFAVRVSRAQPLGLGDKLYRACDLEARSVRLDLRPATHDAHLVQSMERLLPLLQRERAAAVVVTGGSTGALAAALLARKGGSRLARVTPTVRFPLPSLARRNDNLRLIDSIADFLYTTEAAPRDLGSGEAAIRSRVHAVGNLMLDGLNAAFPYRVAPDLARTRALESSGADRGYGLITLGNPSLFADRRRLERTLCLLQAISREVPLIWTATAPIAESIERHGLAEFLRKSWIDILPTQDYLAYVGMLEQARFLICDEADEVELAEASGLRSLWLTDVDELAPQARLLTALPLPKSGEMYQRPDWEVLLEAVPGAKPPRLWDAKSAERVADHLMMVFDQGDPPAGAELRAWTA